jgi:hypothetical protein
MDGVEKNLRSLGVVNWRARAQEGDGWRKFLEQAKAQKGCSANNNNNNNNNNRVYKNCTRGFGDLLYNHLKYGVDPQCLLSILVIQVITTVATAPFFLESQNLHIDGNTAHGYATSSPSDINSSPSLHR